MAEPITGLTATWIPNVGIQLSWTAASDATSGSQYQVYSLENASDIIPDWLLVTTLKPNVSRSISSTVYSLTAPVTSYTYYFKLNQDIDPSYAFNITHIDYTGAASQPVTISTYPTSYNAPYGASHLTNFTSLDAFGQFAINVQDSYEEVADSVGVVVGTTIGSRSVVPKFGIPDLPMTEINVGQIERAINAWEPRANAKVTLQYDDNNNASISVKINPVPGGAQ
jgi:phage baseplate assembly protein W